ncbi:unnamed protein product [Amoebophrya sp. A120]|nr:unnamed protein product [Amoebophrya sp. A120]|eukprot:GSA120T00004425001.1
MSSYVAGRGGSGWNPFTASGVGSNPFGDVEEDAHMDTTTTSPEQSVGAEVDSEQQQPQHIFNAFRSVGSNPFTAPGPLFPPPLEQGDAARNKDVGSSTGNALVSPKAKTAAPALVQHPQGREATSVSSALPQRSQQGPGEDGTAKMNGRDESCAGAGAQQMQTLPPLKKRNVRRSTASLFSNASGSLCSFRTCFTSFPKNSEEKGADSEDIEMEDARSTAQTPSASSERLSPLKDGNGQSNFTGVATRQKDAESRFLPFAGDTKSSSSSSTWRGAMYTGGTSEGMTDADLFSAIAQQDDSFFSNDNYEGGAWSESRSPARKGNQNHQAARDNVHDEDAVMFTPRNDLDDSFGIDEDADEIENYGRKDHEAGRSCSKGREGLKKRKLSPVRHCEEGMFSKVGSFPGRTSWNRDENGAAPGFLHTQQDDDTEMTRTPPRAAAREDQRTGNRLGASSVPVKRRGVRKQHQFIKAHLQRVLQANGAGAATGATGREEAEKRGKVGIPCAHTHPLSRSRRTGHSGFVAPGGFSASSTSASSSSAGTSRSTSRSRMPPVTHQTVERERRAGAVMTGDSSSSRARGATGDNAGTRTPSPLRTPRDSTSPGRQHEPQSEKKLASLSIRELKDILLSTRGVEAPRGTEKSDLLRMIEKGECSVATRRSVAATHGPDSQATGAFVGALDQCAGGHRSSTPTSALLPPASQASNPCSQQFTFEGPLCGSQPASQYQRTSEVQRILAIGTSQHRWGWEVLDMLSDSGSMCFSSRGHQESELRKAVKRLRVLCHPDKFPPGDRGDAETAFKRIVEAEALVKKQIEEEHINSAFMGFFA